jgi:hypothetical protein
LEDYHGGTDIAGRIEVEQSPGFMGWCSYWGGASTSCNYYKQN